VFLELRIRHMSPPLQIVPCVGCSTVSVDHPAKWAAAEQASMGQERADPARLI
jgi:hypothetical protein